MSRARWALWLGPPVAVLAVGLLLSRFQAGVEAGGKTAPPVAGACAGSPVERTAAGKPRRDIGAGTWWRITDRLDQNGAMAGRQLAVGRDGVTVMLVDLGAESGASGPSGGLIVAATDDGRQSEIRLVSPLKSCSWLVDTSRDVVRGAVFDPSDGSVLAHLVKRETRADLGTWRFGGPGGLAKPVLVAPPLPAGDEVVWMTELRLDPAGTKLAVQSCVETECRTRVFDLRQPARKPLLLEGGQGALVGFAGGRIVTWAACPILPCEVLSWDTSTGGHVTVLGAAEAAALTPDGRFVLATLDSTRGRTVRLELATGKQALVRGIGGGELAITGGATSTSGLQVAADEVAIGAVGAVPHSFRPSAAEVLP